MNANLVIVGKVGWQVEETVARLRELAAHEPRMIWFENASDSILLQAYEKATGVIAASFGEGFGLPIVEALVHGKKVLARNIPVFWEIGGESVTYFEGKDSAELARDIESWLRAPTCSPATGTKARLTSWEESARTLIENLPGGQRKCDS